MNQYSSGGNIIYITVDSEINQELVKEIASSIIESDVKYFSSNYEKNQCKRFECP